MTVSQREYWNSAAGARWVQQQPVLDELFRAHGEHALDSALIKDGASVLDVGCGCGVTTLSVAARVGPSGTVLGVDISAPMLALARQRAAERGLSQVHFELGDVQTHELEASRYDAIVSRFGVMFFENPSIAFARLRRTLRDGGHFAAVCWRAPAENPWITLPIAATSALVTVDAIDMNVPGPFSLAPRERTAALLESAGFGDITVTPLDQTLTLGASSEEAASLVVTMGPVGRAMQSVSDDVRKHAVESIAASFNAYQSEAGVRLPSAAWLLTARAG
jgi:SAM-dependent methyltransferase